MTPEREEERPCAPCTSAAGEGIWHGPLGCPQPAQNRTTFRTALRKAAYNLPSPPAVTDLDTAVRLLEAALHLHVNGEQAPGGNETWAALWHDVEVFLRARLDAVASSG